MFQFLPDSSFSSCVPDPQSFYLFKASLQPAPFPCLTKFSPSGIFLSIYIPVSCSSPKHSSILHYIICSVKPKGASLLTLLKECAYTAASSSPPLSGINRSCLVSVPRDRKITENTMLKVVSALLITKSLAFSKLLSSWASP